MPARAIRAADAQSRLALRANGGAPMATRNSTRGSSARTPAARRSRSRRPACAKRSALAGVARSALAPHVDGSLDVTRKSWPENDYYGPGPFNDTTTWDNTAALSLSYNLDLWGRDENAAERALDAAHVRAADARAAQLELETNVVRAYIGLSQDFALLDIAQRHARAAAEDRRSRAAAARRAASARSSK